jgi:hypothetical protein
MRTPWNTLPCRPPWPQSNEWTGKHSFQGRSLHSVGERQNPYETAMSIIGKTLQAFDDDNLIPCYGFGDGARQLHAWRRPAASAGVLAPGPRAAGPGAAGSRPKGSRPKGSRQQAQGQQAQGQQAAGTSPASAHARAALAAGTTHDRNVFSFLPGDQPCNGLEHVLWRYRELSPYIKLAGPTSFAPAIQQATQVVANSGGQ